MEPDGERDHHRVVIKVIINERTLKGCERQLPAPLQGAFIELTFSQGWR
jgi:hypothetical protein